MSTPIGLLGGISAKVEGTYGTNPAGTGWQFQHGISSSLKLNRPTIAATRPGRTPISNFVYTTKYVNGSIELAWSFTDSIVGEILDLATTVSGAGPFIYNFNTAPASNSITARINHGGTALEYAFTGLKCNGMVWNFPPDGNAVFTPSFIGQSMAKEGSPSTVTTPAEADIFMPDDFGDFTLAATTVKFRSGTISIDLPYSAEDRKAYGATVIKEPIESGERIPRFDFEFEVDDSTDEDAITEILDDFIAGTAIGDLVFTGEASDTITLGGCKMEGESPDWHPGVQTFRMQGRANSLIVQCAA